MNDSTNVVSIDRAQIHYNRAYALLRDLHYHQGRVYPYVSRVDAVYHVNRAAHFTRELGLLPNKIVQQARIDIMETEMGA